MTAYYNEIDPYAAQWLRNLIDAGHIARGVVDERSIEDIHPSDLEGFTQCHFFAGVGVWSRALRRAGWPDSRPVWTGSCPCQPFSAAGAGAGFADERHLWPAFHHLIEKRRPAVVLGEQVASRDADPWIDLVCADLEAVGYAVGAVPFPSAGVGAPHIRDRLYWAAHSNNARLEGRRGAAERAVERLAGPRGLVGGLADADGRELEGLAVLRGAERVGTDAGRPEGGRELGACGVVRGLADSHGGHAGAERQQRGGEHGQQPQDGGAGLRLAHSARCGRDEGSGSDCGHAARDGSSDDGGARGLADADRERLPEQHVCVRAEDEGGRHPADLPEAGGRGGLVLVAGERADGRHVGALPAPAAAGPVNGFWRAADWLLCRDGRWRPVEPGTFPLAHGATSRVGRLRAYGNAINASAAEIFIRSVMEAAAS